MVTVTNISILCSYDMNQFVFCFSSFEKDDSAIVSLIDSGFNRVGNIRLIVSTDSNCSQYVNVFHSSQLFMILYTL